MVKVWKLLMKLGIISEQTYINKVCDIDEFNRWFECNEEELPF